MREEMLVFSSWCRPGRKFPFEKYCEILVRISRGERLIKPPWLTEYPEFQFVAEKTTDDLSRDIDQFRRYQESGFDFLLPTDTDYPLEFFYMEDPPTLLYYWGSRSCLRIPKLAVVGSREPSAVSISWVEHEVGLFVEKQPTCLVSGGARGIDQAAHRTAIRKKVPTLVFLPSGFARLYPGNLSQWQKPIWENGGAFVSEYPPDVHIQRAHFIERNRLIAGISIATLLVEARTKSGTLLTARSAIEQGRPVFVMPTHPYDTNGRGGLDLIADGAVLVRDAQELSDFFCAEIKIRDLNFVSAAGVGRDLAFPQPSPSQQGEFNLNI